MSNSRLDGVRKGTRIPDLLLRRQSLYPTELYGPIVLKPAISRGLTPYIVFLGLDNILSEEGIIHGLLLSIYCRVRSHFSRWIELTTELLFFSRLVLALFLRRRLLYPFNYENPYLWRPHIIALNLTENQHPLCYFCFEKQSKRAVVWSTALLEKVFH